MADMQPIKGELTVKIDATDIDKKVKSSKFVEDTFKTKEGTTATVVKIVSDALTGLVNASGKGKIEQGQGVTAKELVQMYNNNVSLNGENVKKIIQSVLTEVFSSSYSKYERVIRDATEDDIYHLNDEDNKKLPKGKVYDKSYFNAWEKYYSLIRSIGEEYFDNIDLSSLEADRYKIQATKETSLGPRFMASLYKNLPTINGKLSLNDKELEKVIEQQSFRMNQEKKEADQILNKEYYDANNEFWTAVRNKIELINSEAGDMNSRSSEEIEAQKQKQSYEEQKYAGWSPKEDEEYLARLMKRYEREGRKQFKEYKGEDFFLSAFETVSKNLEAEENLESDFRSSLYFGKEADVLKNIPSFEKLLPEEGKETYSNLSKLSEFLGSYGKNFDKFLSFASSPISNDEISFFKENFETFISDFTIALQEFYDLNKDSLDKNFLTQMQMRIQGLGKIAGTIYNPDIDEQQKKEVLDNLFNTFFTQVKGHVGSTGIYYEPNIKRSIESKQGLPVKGSYPSSSIPQFLLGSLPYFPVDNEQYYNVSAEEIAQKPGEYSLFDNAKIRTAFELFDKIKQITTRKSEGEIVSEDDQKLFDDMLSYLNTIYANMSQEEKGVLSSEIGATLFEKEGKFSYVGNETETKLKYITDRQGKLKGDSLQRAIQFLEEYSNNISKFIQQTSEDNELEINSIKEFLKFFDDKDTFSVEELNNLYENSENEELFKLLDNIDLDVISNGKETVSKEDFANRLKELQGENSENSSNKIKSLLDNLKNRQKDLQMQDELREYLKQYKEAATPGQRSAVTRKVNKTFGKDSEQAKYFKENRERLVQEIIEAQNEVFEKEANDIFENENKNIEDLKQLKKGIYNVQLDGENFIASMQKVYSDGGKSYSGMGLKIGNKVGFVSDWEQFYERLNEDEQKIFLEKIQKIRANFTKEQDEAFKEELTRRKNIPNNQLSGKLKFDLLGATDNTINELPKEEKTIDNLNDSYEEHVKVAKEAAESEQGKILVSKELASVLAQEQNKIQEDTQALKEHNEELDKVKVSYEPSVYNKEIHEYTSILTGKPADLTITEASGRAFSDFSEQSKIDFKKISNALTNAALNGADFSPESLGFLNANTGLVDKKAWNSMIKSQSKTLAGTALHKVAEFGAVYKSDTLEGIKANATPEALEEFNDTINLITKKLKILGVDLSETDLQQFLTAYMDLFLPKDESGKRDYDKLLLAETPLMGRFAKGYKNITVGGTADALFAGQYGSSLIDFKTGSSLSPEKNTVQLSINSRLLEEAIKAGAIPNISLEQFQNIIERSILHYVNGTMTKINYGQLSDEQIFEVLEAAMSGVPIPKEQRARYNLESQIGRQSTVKPGEKTSESLGFTGNDREIYRAMMNDVKTMQKAKKQIAVLDAAISKSSGDVKKDLEAQKSSQEDILNLAQQAYEQSKAQLSLDQTKEQLLENERQREQRVDLSQTEIDAAAEKTLQQAQAKVSKDALKNFKNSNKAVLDQQLELERAQLKLSQYSGDSDKERKALEMNVETQQRLLELKKQDQALLDGNILKYKNVNGEWQEIELSQEQVAQAQKTLNDLTDTYAGKSAKVQATIKESTGLFDKLFSGLKRSVMNLIDYSLAGILVGKVRESLSQVIEITKQLDAALVDLQIAAGTSRKETSAMLLEYNDLAKEVGRTTQEVAEASNDWLRAGYEGAEAAELTRASMELSTLGMIDASTATTDLISVLKGWKLETEDVGSVVDKLTVIICGVCQVIGIGHELKCR